MKSTHLLLLKNLDAKSLALFEGIKKSKPTAFMLALFLGGFGAQWFYLGKIVTGILSVLFCWTLIPGIISLISLFFISPMIDKHNLAIIQTLQPGAPK